MEKYENGYYARMLNKNTYFQTDPLVAQKFIAAPFPYSHIPKDFMSMYYPENKEIREDVVCVILATKGDLENKGFFDIQSNSLNLPRLIQIYNPVADARNEYIYSAAGQKLKVLHIWDPYFQTLPVNKKCETLVIYSCFVRFKISPFSTYQIYPPTFG